MNYQSIILQLTSFLQGFLIKYIPLTASTGLSYLSATKERLKQLAENYATGNISQGELTQALIDEKDIFLSEVSSFEIIGLELSQEIINNAEAVFLKIVNINQ